VTTEACESCHGDRIGNVGQGGGYTKVKTCNNCHNVNYMASRNGGEGDLAFMIHRIHDAGSFDQLEGGIDFSHVTFPQHIYTCSKCHTADAPNANLSELVPTRTNCGSCHDEIDFTETDSTSPSYHPGGSMPDDSECSICHGPAGSFVDSGVVHNPDPKPENVPEYAVTIDMTDPANGTHYVAGETPLVTVTLAGENPVDYDADQDAEGDTDGVLSEAELFVYGPRSNAVPVLTSNSTTDPAWDPLTSPIQGLDLLLTGGVSTDPQVATDATGYKYQLMDNIGDLVPGTYMVRFEGLDYGTPGAPSVPEYWTASSAVITFQVGTAEEEAKVSGDACTNCHGDTIMHLEGAHPHHQSFDTDGCLGCHDLSDNYAEYIGNRVHAVHSASATGDTRNRDWTHVTFPRPANNCRTCHTNPATEDTGFVPVWRDPNEVACGGCHGTDRLADPADYDPDLASKIIREASAAAHMAEMGGTFEPETTNPNDPNYVARQCIVCHGEDRIADLFVTHGLVNFPATDTSTPED